MNTEGLALPKANMDPENGSLEDEDDLPLQTQVVFRVHASFQGTLTNSHPTLLPVNPSKRPSVTNPRNLAPPAHALSALQASGGWPSITTAVRLKRCVSKSFRERCRALGSRFRLGPGGQAGSPRHRWAGGAWDPPRRRRSIRSDHRP